MNEPQNVHQNGHMETKMKEEQIDEISRNEKIDQTKLTRGQIALQLRKEIEQRNKKPEVPTVDLNMSNYQLRSEPSKRHMNL